MNLKALLVMLSLALSALIFSCSTTPAAPTSPPTATAAPRDYSAQYGLAMDKDGRLYSDSRITASCGWTT
jgi:hypothetical protein